MKLDINEIRTKIETERPFFVHLDNFIKHNGEHRSALVFNTIFEIMEKHNLNLVKSTIRAWPEKGISYNFSDNVFDFNVSEKFIPSMSDKDIIWTVYHEFGHYMDKYNNKLEMDYDKLRIIFRDAAGEKHVINPIEMRSNHTSAGILYGILGMCDIVKKELETYCLWPTEISANTFAVINSPVIPDHEIYKFSYDFTKKIIEAG